MRRFFSKCNLCPPDTSLQNACCQKLRSPSVFVLVYPTAIQLTRSLDGQVQYSNKLLLHGIITVLPQPQEF